ncbi:MAG: translation initiation factor IF-3 [Bacteroidetes bacterium]|nr:MAG: translation initiation factor IF-3 [Bacteroidota bacterium]
MYSLTAVLFYLLTKKIILAKRRSRNPNQGKAKFNFRVNERIRIPEVRLVGDNLDEISEKIGQKIESGIYSTNVLRRWADEVDLDLVEISPNANPPVVRITDYNKFLYERKKKEKELKSKTAKTVVKEIRFGPNTDDHDFNFKLRHAIKFLKDGAKVKAFVQFRGRTIVFKDRGQLLLLKFINELEEYGAVEALPKMEGRRMFVMITPKKK